MRCSLCSCLNRSAFGKIWQKKACRTRGVGSGHECPCGNPDGQRQSDPALVVLPRTRDVSVHPQREQIADASFAGSSEQSAASYDAR